MAILRGNASSRARICSALTREDAAAAMAARSTFFAAWARPGNSHQLRSIWWGLVRDHVPRIQAAFRAWCAGKVIVPSRRGCSSEAKPNIKVCPNYKTRQSAPPANPPESLRFGTQCRSGWPECGGCVRRPPVRPPPVDRHRPSSAPQLELRPPRVRAR